MVRKLLARGQARLLGGEASGQPPVLQYLHRCFDPEQTVDRKFVIFEDTGFIHTGFTVAELVGEQLDVLVRGILTTRTPDIKDIMDERRAHRRARRRHRRLRTRRRSKAQGRNLNKHRPPRWKNRRKRDPITIRHAVQTHLNLFDRLLRLAPIPAHQVVRGFEYAKFDLRKMVWGPTKGKGYQQSPRGRKSGEAERDFVMQRFEGRCFVCRATEHLQIHHVRPRSQQGSERAENKVVLCGACHGDVHRGLVLLPLKGTEHQWRATTNTNIVCGILRKDRSFRYVHAGQVAWKRRNLGLAKDHDWDAVAGAAALLGASKIHASEAFVVELRQVRRHRRAKIHSQRNRIYKIRGANGKLKTVAINRRKATEQNNADQAKTLRQKHPSLAEFRKTHPRVIGRLQVAKSVRIMAPDRKRAKVFPGEIWVLPDGRPFLADGQKDKGRNITSKQLKGLIGKSYVSTRSSRRLIRNQGLVVVPQPKERASSSP